LLDIKGNIERRKVRKEKEIQEERDLYIKTKECISERARKKEQNETNKQHLDARAILLLLRRSIRPVSY
jgi:hypothetical protein